MNAMRIAAILAAALTALGAAESATPARIPVINVTDLYHPHQDVGDNVDLITAYALPEIDLKAIVLDCTDSFRPPVTGMPDTTPTWEDGPRDPGLIPVWQLNAVFGRNVPCGVGPFRQMTALDDTMADVPPFQQQGVELLLRTLRESPVPVHIVSFGSARPVAVAFNREPELLRAKAARIHLCAGGTSPPVPGFTEWNVLLDPIAIVRLLRSDLPIALYPCAANNTRGSGPESLLPVFSYDEHNTFYHLTDLRFIPRMAPPLRRYLEYAFTRSSRVDFLRAVEVDGPPLDDHILDRKHSVWETAVWLCVSGRKLVRRADGAHRIVAAAEVLPTDTVLPNELRPCTVAVRDDGIFESQETDQPTNFLMYYRGDPRENENALREAMPAMYLGFRP